MTQHCVMYPHRGIVNTFSGLSENVSHICRGPASATTHLWFISLSAYSVFSLLCSVSTSIETRWDRMKLFVSFDLVLYFYVKCFFSFILFSCCFSGYQYVKALVCISESDMLYIIVCLFSVSRHWYTSIRTICWTLTLVMTLETPHYTSPPSGPTVCHWCLLISNSTRISLSL